MHRNIITAVALLSLFPAAQLPCSAQDLRKIQPRDENVLGPAPREEIAPAPRPAFNIHQQILPKLKGLVVSSDPKAGDPGARGLVWKGLEPRHPAEMEKKLAPFFGRPLTMGGLGEITKILQDEFDSESGDFTRVLVPEQEVSSGVLTVLVVESRLGQVNVEGAKWFPESSYRSAIRTQPGQILRKSTLDADIDWINANPRRSVTVDAYPGSEFGTTNLTLQAADIFPVGGYFTYQDAGNPSVGTDQFIFGVTWDNAFSLGHRFAFQETDSTDFDRYLGHAATYTIPLPWRHNLTFNGSYATVNPDVPAGFASDNYAWQTGGMYEVPLPVYEWAGIGKLKHSLSAGFEFKETNNNLLFTNIPVIDNTTQIFEFIFNYGASFEDRFGSTYLSVNGVYEPGGWSGTNSDASFNTSRAGATAEFGYANITAVRQTRLPWNFSHSITGIVQMTDNNLLGSEQMGFTGMGAVRGYDDGILYGDEGWLMRNELRLPPFSISGIFAPVFGQNIGDDEFQALAFYDYGSASNAYLLPGEPESTWVSSVGVGFRYRISRYFSMSFDYGWQLNDLAYFGTEGTSRAHITATLRY